LFWKGLLDKLPIWKGLLDKEIVVLESLLDKEIAALERLVIHLTLALWEGQEALKQVIIQRWLGFVVGRLL